jgi:hypothetical protein
MSIFGQDHLEHETYPLQYFRFCDSQLIRPNLEWRSCRDFFIKNVPNVIMMVEAALSL